MKQQEPYFTFTQTSTTDTTEFALLRTSYNMTSKLRSTTTDSCDTSAIYSAADMYDVQHWLHLLHPWLWQLMLYVM